MRFDTSLADFAASGYTFVVVGEAEDRIALPFAFMGTQGCFTVREHLGIWIATHVGTGLAVGYGETAEQAAHLVELLEAQPELWAFAEPGDISDEDFREGARLHARSLAESGCGKYPGDKHTSPRWATKAQAAGC